MRWSEVRVFQTSGDRRNWERAREFVAVTPLGLNDPLEHGSTVGRPGTTSVVVSAATDLAAGESASSHESGPTTVALAAPAPTPRVPAGDHEIGKPSADEIDARRGARRIELASSPPGEVAARAQPTRVSRTTTVLGRARCRAHRRRRRLCLRLRLIDGRTLDRAPRRCAGRGGMISGSGSSGAGTAAAARRGPRAPITDATCDEAAVGPATRAPGSEEAHAQHAPRTGQPTHVSSTAATRARLLEYPSDSALTSGSNKRGHAVQAAPRRSADPVSIAAMSATGLGSAVRLTSALRLPTPLLLLDDLVRETTPLPSRSAGDTELAP